MVAESRGKNQLLNKVAEIYDWLDEQIRLTDGLVIRCDGCGRCCDFEVFDHRLFVTPPELMYLAANLGDENLKPMPDSRCPYHLICECTVYEYRFAGCRIFSCKGDADFQSRLSESALKKFKSICTEFKIPYRYTDLATALENISKL
ncbi:MAG: hypothetical protein OEW48_12505 [Phycisphaerae bacterium]|nr:hypothetical protein [Phycisphaerae bacterium]